jgi:hypothetical protein
MYELRSVTGVVIWSGNSVIDPMSVLPDNKVKFLTDHFLLPSSTPKGSYGLYLVIRDPQGFRQPLPLAISGRNADGSYLIRNNITIGISDGAGKK